MRLENKVALLTGAASARAGQLMGFGGATAHAFVREGAKVVITDILDELGEASAAEMRAAGADVVYRHLDVTSEEGWRRAIDATVEQFGGLDILVNNAGTAFMMSIEEMSEEVWDAELSVHAKGVFLGTKHAIPAMRKGGGGAIVNISSIMGIVGSPTAPAYAAAKGAVRLFTKTTALQYANDNIRANSVHPGYALTPLTAERLAVASASQALIDKTPLGRLGTAEDIAAGIVYLASDEAAFVTGAELVIDGGMIAQ